MRFSRRSSVSPLGTESSKFASVLSEAEMMTRRAHAPRCLGNRQSIRHACGVHRLHISRSWLMSKHQALHARHRAGPAQARHELREVYDPLWRPCRLLKAPSLPKCRGLAHLCAGWDSTAVLGAMYHRRPIRLSCQSLTQAPCQ